MQSINERLRALYHVHQQGINAIYDRVKGGEANLDGPHLLHCWEEEYTGAQYKLFFLGQENNTWNGPETDVDGQIGFYEWFEHGKDYNSTYWLAVHYFNELIQGSDTNRLGFVASNVSKYCSQQGKAIKEWEMELVVKEANLLPGELSILQPDIVLFLSGPYYDKAIQLQLGEDVAFEPLVDGIASRELARVSHPLLPPHAYRTYHPGHLSRGKKNNYLQLIAATIKNYDINLVMATYRHLMWELSAEFDLTMEEPGGFPGNASDGFYFYPPQWQWCAIGFEFENNGAGSHFIGICRRESNTPIPETVKTELQDRLPASGDGTAYWPWWQWYDEKDWGEKTMTEILSGEMKVKVRVILHQILRALDAAAI